MKESSLVVLSADDKAVSLKTLRDMYLGVKQMYDWLSKDGLTEEMKNTIASLVEMQLADLSKLLRFDSQAAKEVETRFGDIRNLNLRIQELERQLGSGAPLDSLTAQLQWVSDLVKKWWKIEGFGYVDSLSFNDYGGLEVNFGVSFRRTFLHSKTPVTDRESQEQWLLGLESQGYRVHINEDDHDKHLLDCPENRTMITQLFEQRFPSAEIDEWQSRRIFRAKERLYSIERIRVYLRDVREVRTIQAIVEPFIESESASKGS